jgi:hypothetical protein
MAIFSTGDRGKWLLPMFSAAFATAITAATPTLAADDVMTALTEGKFDVNIRYRFEYVDQDGKPEEAYANTVRTAVGYETADLHGFILGAEVEWVLGIGSERYNDTQNGKTSYPVVADPENLEANQYYIGFNQLPESQIKVGRQKILLDNQRFVGPVGFRQNHQTFDAARLTSNYIPDVTATYAYVWLVNRVVGEDNPRGDFESDSHLINVSYSGIPFGKLTGYGYLLDFDEVPGLSSMTFGGRFAGKHALSEPWSLFYVAEAAIQSDYASNPNDGSFNYYLIEPGIAYKTFKARIGYEVLSGNGRQSFQMPLATLHAFQGWADKFLATPAGGIEDAYLRLDYVVKGLDFLDGTKFIGAYHDFNAQNSNANYGSEFDLLVKKKVHEFFTVELKYANYDAKDFATDTEKFWASVIFKY